MLTLNKLCKYVLACSYGPDSMALFDMLIKNNYKFVVAHVNYHKRAIANEEERQLKEYCQNHNIPCYVLDTTTLKKTKENFQAWARQVRYSFFYDVVTKINGDAVLVAHHLDDLLETYLMQKSRAAFVEYYGLKQEVIINNAKIIRPLLSFEKKELEQYCLNNNVPFSIDESNLADTYTRNKIRHQYIEKMTTSQKQSLLNEIIEKNNWNLQQQNKYINLIKTSVLSYEKLLKIENSDVQFLVFNNFLKFNNATKLVSYKQFEEIMKSFKSKKTANIKNKLSTQEWIVKSYDEISIVFEKRNLIYSYIMKEPAELDTEYFYLNLKDSFKNYRLTINDFPITIRPVKSGDMSYINGIPKKITRLYIDWKMPKQLRAIWPLIFNKDGKLIYVLRYDNVNSISSREDFVVKR